MWCSSSSIKNHQNFVQCILRTIREQNLVQDLLLCIILKFWGQIWHMNNKSLWKRKQAADLQSFLQPILARLTSLAMVCSIRGVCNSQARELQKSVVNTKFQNLSKTRTMNGQENKSEHYIVTRTKRTSFTSKQGVRIKSCKHTSTLAKFQTHFSMWKSLFIYKIHWLFGLWPQFYRLQSSYPLKNQWIARCSDV